MNVNRCGGDFNKLHVHVPAAYSGAYYVQIPANAEGGDFVLPTSTTSGDGGAENQAKSEVKFAQIRPVRGTLLLFPATMLHAVLPTWAKGAEDEERISIGFNVSPFW